MKETDTGTLDTGGDSVQAWQNQAFGFLRQLGTVAVDNLTRQNTQDRQEQPGSMDRVPWYMKPPVLIGAAVVGVLVLVLALRK